MSSLRNLEQGLSERSAYLIPDAIYLKVRNSGTVINMAILIGLWSKHGRQKRDARSISKPIRG